jgi:hypothetical protein
MAKPDSSLNNDPGEISRDMRQTGLVKDVDKMPFIDPRKPSYQVLHTYCKSLQSLKFECLHDFRSVQFTHHSFVDSSLRSLWLGWPERKQTRPDARDLLLEQKQFKTTKKSSETCSTYMKTRIRPARNAWAAAGRKKNERRPFTPPSSERQGSMSSSLSSIDAIIFYMNCFFFFFWEEQ